MKLDVIVFTSPKAGSGAAREQIPLLTDLLARDGISHQVLSCPDALRQMVAERRETGVPQPIVVAAGGDGTLSLVASSTRPETPLLPMPMGTENLLARHLGQTSDAGEIMKTLKSGQAIKLDAGEANGRLFLIMATVGFDAEVVRRLHQGRKGHIRRSSYLTPIIKTILEYRFPKLKVETFADAGSDNSGEVDALSEHAPIKYGPAEHAPSENAPSESAPSENGWAMVFNLPCYAAGLDICPEAVGNDGRLDLITFAGRGVLTGLRYLAGISTGRHQKFADVSRRRVSHLRIESESPVAYELDGDYAGQLPLEIKTIPGRVTLMVPEQATRRGYCATPLNRTESISS